jgi:peptide/nickel transport system permease protein
MREEGISQEALSIREQSYRSMIRSADEPGPEIYTGLGDALLTRFFKSESENWELLREAQRAYRDALEISPGYEPAITSIGVIKRYLELSGGVRLAGDEKEFTEQEAPSWEEGRGAAARVLASSGRFLSNWRNLVPLLMVSAIFLVAIFAPWISPPADSSNPLPFKLVESKELVPLPPFAGVPLGTVMYYVPGLTSTLLHFDVLHSVVWGTRDALRFGLAVALFSALLGVLVGAISGYAGGGFNNLVMRFTDAFLAFPIVAGVWLIQQLAFQFEQSGSFLASWYLSYDAVVAPVAARQRLLMALGLSPVFIAFILFSWMPYARLINVGFLRLKNADYIMAARTIGASHFGVIFKHLLPNAITPIVVLLARDIGALVVLRAAFAFIGLGGSIQAGLPEWDRLLLLGRTWIIGVGGNVLLYWWLYLPVTLALVFFGVSWNLFGDRLNVLLNPRELN